MPPKKPAKTRWTPERIEQLREKLGVSVDELAGLLALGRAGVYHYLSGARQPNSQTCLLLDLLEKGAYGPLAERDG